MKLFSWGFIEQFVNFSITTGFESESKKSRINTSKVPLLNEIFAIDILTSMLDVSPSAIVINLNKLNTLLPLNSETNHGEVADWYLSKYHAIDCVCCVLASGKSIKEQFNPLMKPFL